MLILGLAVGESLMIGDEVEIKHLPASGTDVKLGIQAPKHVKILRRKLWLEPCPTAKPKPEGPIASAMPSLG